MKCPLRFSLTVIGLSMLMRTHTFGAGPVHEIVWSFGKPPEEPRGGPLVPGPDDWLWGTTVAGGAHDDGTVFKVKRDGGDWQTVVSFNENPSHNLGGRPMGSLLRIGPDMWGTASWPGAINSNGMVYKIEAATGKLTKVADLNDSIGDYPAGSLVLDDAGMIWGTAAGAVLENGSIFKVNPSTGALTRVIAFTSTGAVNRGANPMAGLVNTHDGYLWGTTSTGAAGHGTVFKINVASGVLTTVVDFTGNAGAAKGSASYGELFDDGTGNLWGTTALGGANGNGTVFKVKRSNGAFQSILDFTYSGPQNRGSQPRAGLVRGPDGLLWGTTSGGSDTTIFKVDPATGLLSTVKQFSFRDVEVGSRPEVELWSDGTEFMWGMTTDGGGGSYGAVFKISAFTGNIQSVVQFIGSGRNSQGHTPYSGVTSDGRGGLWGTTYYGGIGSSGHQGGDGTVYRFDEATGEMKTVVAFTGESGSARGKWPIAGLLSASDGFLWGSTESGGQTNLGTIFRIDSVTRDMTTVIQGTPAVQGTHAILHDNGDGFLWGTARRGRFGWGSIYKINMASGQLTSVRDIQYNDAVPGEQPRCTLEPDGTGNFWGTASGGGGNGWGTVFKLNPGTGELTTLIELSTLGASGPAYPKAGLVNDGAGYMWGTTEAGGPEVYGTVFKIAIETGAWTTVGSFNGSNGSEPHSGLTYDGAGHFWGTAFRGGVDYQGTVYKVAVNSGAMSVMHHFREVADYVYDGRFPSPGNLLLHSDGNWYGTTEEGGPNAGGTIYRLRFGPTPVTNAADSVTAASAVLNGTVNPNGAGFTAIQFEWSSDPFLTNPQVVSVDGLPDGATPAPVSAALAALQPGTNYYFRVAASNDGNAIPQKGFIQSFMTSLPSPAEWRQSWFGSPDSIGDGADGADPDRDGVVNLMEFATNGNPVSSGPMPGTATVSSGQFGFSYIRSRAALQAQYVFKVEWSPTLTTPVWSTLGITQSVLSESASAQTVKTSIPVANGTGRLFVRLRVEAPHP